MVPPVSFVPCSFARAFSHSAHCLMTSFSSFLSARVRSFFLDFEAVEIKLANSTGVIKLFFSSTRLFTIPLFIFIGTGHLCQRSHYCTYFRLYHSRIHSFAAGFAFQPLQPFLGSLNELSFSDRVFIGAIFRD